MTEQDLLLDCARRLNASGVQYMLTGSMASNAWGVPRSTHGLDFVVQLPPSQVLALVTAFAGSDYFLDEASVRAAYRPPHRFNLIHVPAARKGAASSNAAAPNTQSVNLRLEVICAREAG